MHYFDARIIGNRALGNGYFALRLGGCDSLAASRPGQFVMLRGDWGRDPLLPRPMSLLSVAPEGRADMLAKAFRICGAMASKKASSTFIRLKSMASPSFGNST